MPTTSALDVVDGEVRELIRRRGLDPFTDPGPVRVLVRAGGADYSERSPTAPPPRGRGAAWRPAWSPPPPPAPGPPRGRRSATPTAWCAACSTGWPGSGRC